MSEQQAGLCVRARRANVMTKQFAILCVKDQWMLITRRTGVRYAVVKLMTQQAMTT